MDILSYHSPAAPPIGLISIPHSGEWIPEEFRSFLKAKPEDWAQDVDTHVDKLIDFAQLGQLGVAILNAHVHRITIDLNRARGQALFAWPLNTHGVPIIAGRPSAAVEEQLLGKYFDPYYELMRSLAADLHGKCPKKKVPFIDLHSMPSAPTSYHMKQNPSQPNTRPDFCLSDYRGTTCPPLFIQRAKTLIEKQGFTVEINNPYIGGHITQFLGSLPGLQNIQIEINRRLYMDEKSRQLNHDALSKFAPVLTVVLKELFQEFSP